MMLPLQLPPWLPWWLPFLVLALGALYLLAFLLMPFSVFGLKGRLEGIEARLDEIQTEVRRLALRFPEPSGSGEYEEEALPLPLPFGRFDAGMKHPPVSPAPQVPAVGAAVRSAGSSGRGNELDARQPRVRAEPRLDWPH